MKKIVFIIPFLMIAFGCSKGGKLEGSSEDFMLKLSLAPSNIVSKDNLPEWLSTKIAEYEEWPAGDISISSVKIFKGKWEKRTVYYIKNSLASCLFCDIYYEEGEKVKLTDKEVLLFYGESNNWVLIFNIGSEL